MLHHVLFATTVRRCFAAPLAWEPFNLTWTRGDATGASIPSSSEVVVFIHIQKTGGSSFWKTLVRHMPHSVARYPGNGTNSWNSPGCTDKSYGGTHCGFSQIDDCLGLGFALGIPASARRRYVTLVRDPVLRTISEYYYWEKSGPYVHWSAEMVANNRSLEAWTLTPANVAGNKMTRALASFHDDPVRRGAKQCTNFDFDLLDAWWRMHYACNTTECWVSALNEDDSVLRNAMENLVTNFAFVGLTEAITESLELLYAVAGLPAQAQLSLTRIPRLHASGQELREVPSAGVVEHILMRNRLDVGLYEFAKRRFEATRNILLPVADSESSR